MVPVQTWPGRLARKTTVSVPAWFAMMPVDAERAARRGGGARCPRATRTPLSVMVHAEGLADDVGVDLGLDLEAPVVGLDLELPGAAGRAGARDADVVAAAGGLRGDRDGEDGGGGQAGHGECCGDALHGGAPSVGRTLVVRTEVDPAPGR